MKKPDYKIGDYVEFKYNGYLKKGWVEQVVKLENISSDMFVLKTKSGKTYYVADGIIGDSFKIIRKLPILRDKNGRFCKKDCSCFNCNQCAEQMRAYYEKTGELKPSNVTKGPVNNSTGGGKTTETVTEDYMYTLEFGQMPYDEFGSRVKTEEKKPSDRLNEILKETAEKVPGDETFGIWHSINRYLDECWEKGK